MADTCPDETLNKISLKMSQLIGCIVDCSLVDRRLEDCTRGHTAWLRELNIKIYTSG
jgi:hypothetical protein